MSIKFPGLNQADSYKTSKTGLSGGFITNDAAGELQYDQVGPPTDASQWSLIESKKLQIGDATGNNNVTFAGLDGDVDGIYKLIMWQTNASRTGQSEYLVYPNGISGETQFLGRSMRGLFFPQLITYDDSFTGWKIGPQFSSSTYSFAGGRAVMYIHARSGKPRFVIHHLMEMRGGRNFFLSSEPGVINSHEFGVWPDTTTNITSLVIHNRFNNNPPNLNQGSFQGEWSLYKVNI